MAGTTCSDMERVLGEPNRVNGNNTEVHYQYKADK